MAKPLAAAAVSVALTLAGGAAIARPFIPSVAIDDNVFRYTGAWTHVTGKIDGRFGGTSSRSDRRGATARIRFNGSALALYAVLGPAGGYGTVYLDARRVARIDFFSWHIRPRDLVYRTPLLARGPHELEIVADGTRRSQSFGMFVNLDAAVIGDPVVAATIPRRASPHVRGAAPASAPTAVPATKTQAANKPPVSVGFIAAILSVIALAAVLVINISAFRKRRRTRPNEVRTPPAYGIPVSAVPATPEPSPETAAAPLYHPNGNGNGKGTNATLTHTVAIDWPHRVSVDAPLDDDARRRLLATLAAEPVPVDPAIFATAFEQEHTPQMRAAVIASIRDGGFRDALPTIRAAYREGDEALRTVAVGALARVGDYQTIEDALEDASTAVATVAAYELIGAYGNERAATVIARRIADPVRRREITGTLGLFS